MSSSQAIAVLQALQAPRSSVPSFARGGDGPNGDLDPCSGSAPGGCERGNRGGIKGCARSSADALRIGGLTSMTTVDYPGELAAVIFCQGCPWRCRYCHNGHLLPGRAETEISWGQVRALLEKRRGLLDAIVFSGGEPTLQAALPEAMAEVEAMGFKVGLHTAGPYPQRLRRLLPYLDWVGLDIKALPEDYPQITGVPGSGTEAWESLRLFVNAGVGLEVRTTPLPGWSCDEKLGPLMHRLAECGVTDYILQQCRTEQSIDPSLRIKPAGLPPSESFLSMGKRLFARFSLRAP